MQNGYSLDYLKPFYECKICNDTGFVLDKNYKTTMCNCLKQKLLNISFNIIPQDSFRFSSEDAVMIEPGFKYRIYVFLFFQIEFHPKYHR